MIKTLFAAFISFSLAPASPIDVKTDGGLYKTEFKPVVGAMYQRNTAKKECLAIDGQDS